MRISYPILHSFYERNIQFCLLWRPVNLNSPYQQPVMNGPIRIKAISPSPRYEDFISHTPFSLWNKYKFCSLSRSVNLNLPYQQPVMNGPVRLKATSPSPLLLLPLLDAELLFSSSSSPPAVGDSTISRFTAVRPESEAFYARENQPIGDQ